MVALAMSGDDRAFEELVRRRQGAIRRLMDATVKMDLEKALARLSPAERLCVVLSYSERMSHGEIQSATGFPLGTVKSHISRGSARLRRHLRDYEGDVP